MKQQVLYVDNPFVPAMVVFLAASGSAIVCALWYLSTQKKWASSGIFEASKRTREIAAAKPLRSVQMEKDKFLFYKLLNFENWTDAIEEAHDRLRSLLNQTTAAALADKTSLMSKISSFNPEYLEKHLQTSQNDATERFVAYVARRKNGGEREMFEDAEAANVWLRDSAPVKFVDGVWLQNVFRLSAPEEVKELLWRIMSEELGDGDLNKNHIYLYQKLMKEINAGLPPAHSIEFISPELGLNEPRVWKAALAQILISLFPESYVPELIGFVLAYESLPYHLLVTIHELKELKIDPYYFILHVSIDNADCGHAKMSYDAVCKYMDSVTKEERGPTWRRICAGFELAEGLPTTPDLERKKIEKAMGEILARKSDVAKGAHAGSKARINGKSLANWLDPEILSTECGRFSALRDLAESRRWIVKGCPDQSQLLKTMRWGGIMYGAWTKDEERITEAWIRSLREGLDRIVDKDLYQAFIGTNSAPRPKILRDEALPAFFCNRPSVSRSYVLDDKDEKYVVEPRNFFKNDEAISSKLLGLLYYQERLLGPPSKSSNPNGMAILRLLHCFHGYHSDSDIPDEESLLSQLARRETRMNNFSELSVSETCSIPPPTPQRSSTEKSVFFQDMRNLTVRETYQTILDLLSSAVIEENAINADTNTLRKARGMIEVLLEVIGTETSPSHI